MKKQTRIVALLLVMIQLLLAFAACGGEEPATTAAPATTQAPAQRPATTETPTTQREDPSTGGDEQPESEPLLLVEDGKAQYVIVLPLGVSSERTSQVHAFREELREITGASFKLKTDFESPEDDREIVIGACEGRPKSAEVFQQISYTESRMTVAGNTIVLATWVDTIERMLDYILDAIYETEDGDWAVDGYMMEFTFDYRSKRAIPPYETEKGELSGNTIYLSSAEGYTVGIDGTNAEEFSAYLTKLEGLGYEKYTENSIGLVDFYTYTKRHGAETQILHVQYNVSDEAEGPGVKITLAIDEELPALEAEPYTKLADSSINCLERVTPEGWGMGMVFQLADGSFVIVDGGYDPNFSDSARLISFMTKNKPAEHEKPVISCWLWTHPHGDHVGICRQMLKAWKDRVEIKTFAYNYINFDEYAGSGADPGLYYGSELVREAETYYPDAKHWIMHAGQKMYIADAVIECIWSHEDVFPMAFIGVNDTDTVFSITIDGVKTMMLGDCENPNSKMISYYKEAMRSPVVQNSHHSINGPKKMYEYIDPIHSFWACPEDQMSIQAQRDHMRYLLSTQWTRTNAAGETVTGERNHYHNSETTCLYIKDLKLALEGLS